MYSYSTLTITIVKVYILYWGTTISIESTLIYHYHHLGPRHHFITRFDQINDLH